MKTPLIEFLIIVLTIINVNGQSNFEIQQGNLVVNGKIEVGIDTNSVLIGTNVGNDMDFSLASKNTIIGHQSGKSITSGRDNTFLGFEAGFNETVGKSNTYIGHQSGFMAKLSNSNTFIGEFSGKNLLSGNNNVYIGTNSGFSNSSVSNNTVIGTSAGGANGLGDNNVFIGMTSGSSNQGTNNIFIGYKSGMNEIGSNKLYIHNSESAQPLIYGEFDNQKIQINGHLRIEEFARLKPRSDPPSNPEFGMIYYDSDDNKVKVWTGIWENLN